MYARQSPEVYSALSSIGTNYIILEDSICLAAPSPNNSDCRLTDIMDIVDTSNSYDTAPNSSDSVTLFATEEIMPRTLLSYL